MADKQQVRILLVDDNKEIIDSLEFLFQTAFTGFSVQCDKALNIADAEKLLRENPNTYSLIITDFDLGNRQRGTDLVDTIINKLKYKTPTGQDVSVAIHSGNSFAQIKNWAPENLDLRVFDDNMQDGKIYYFQKSSDWLLRAVHNKLKALYPSQAVLADQFLKSAADGLSRS